MTAKEFLEQTSPNDKYGLRAELQKHRLRRMVEKEMEMYHQAKLKLLGIGGVSGTVGLEDAKKVLLRYDQAIKEEIAVKLEWLRDHGTHAEFCHIITDIRENVLDTYR